MNTFLISAACFVVAVVITWILRKLIFEKNYIPANDFDFLKEQLQQLKTQKAVDDENLGRLSTEKARLTDQIDEMTEATKLISSELAERTADRKNLEENLNELKSQLANVKDDYQQKQRELNEAGKSIADLKAELRFAKEKLDTQKQEMDELGQKFEGSFKLLAQQILDDKTKKFTEEQEKNLKGILDPLEKEIKQFKADIETRHKQESDERISLREQVKNMTQLNQNLSDQANKLAETLRLQVKQQGDWGETILEAILENSGLQKDLQYFTQHSANNEEGKTIRPDVLIKYPDNRAIVIDSKVSLVHYYNMCSATEEEDREKALNQLVNSMRSHIDNLASKNYQDITQALDFVIMFVPVEPAYIAAMHADNELWQYAYKKSILLISPANLIATLKIVNDMWRKDGVDKNAQLIADKAGKLYDKLVLFIENFEEIGRKLDKTVVSWQDARRQLTLGKGNLLSRALQMNTLRIGSKKKLPEDLTGEAILNDYVEEQESISTAEEPDVNGDNN